MAKGRKNMATGGGKPEAVREEPTELRKGKEEPMTEPELLKTTEGTKEAAVTEEENMTMGGNEPEAVQEEPAELRKGKEEPAAGPELPTTAEGTKEPMVTEEGDMTMGGNEPEAVQEEPAELRKGKEEPAAEPGLPITTEGAKEETVTEESEKEPENGKTRQRYQITCRNPINESFAGVSFQNGTAFTKDAFTASWFANKEGYTVHKEKGS